MKIGILGGTFNPIHYGHTFVANYILDYMHLDKILFIPSGKPPHKKHVISREHRLHMVEIAVKDNKNFEIDEVEIRKDDYSYSYDTLTYLKNKRKDDEFFFIIGQDAMLDVNLWYEYEKVIAMTQFIVVVRGEEIKEKLQNIYKNAKMYFVDSPTIEISSTDIRARLSENKTVKYYVDRDVEEYMQKNNLYKEII